MRRIVAALMLLAVAPVVAVRSRPGVVTTFRFDAAVAVRFSSLTGASMA